MMKNKEGGVDKEDEGMTSYLLPPIFCLSILGDLFYTATLS